MRRVVMPAAILIVAAGLAVLGLRERADQRVEVEHFVEVLVQDAAAGRDPAAYLAHSDPIVTRPMLAALEELVAQDTWKPDDLEIAVEEGDPESDATFPQPATHTATLLRRGRVLLGLRLVHQGRRDRIAVIGFWRPPAEEAED